MKLYQIKCDIKHFGLKYICPMCGFHQSSLKPIQLKDHKNWNLHIVGGGPRPCYCWHCHSTDRERLIFLYCKKTLNLFSENRSSERIKMLHIAPEKNLSKVFLEADNIDYIAGDFFQEGYQYPDYVQHMDITNLPFDDNQFDIVICCHVLEHIPNDNKAIQELFRVLKPGGKAILQVPLCLDNLQTIEDINASAEEKQRRFGQWDHLRLYGLDYKDQLERNGFKVEVVAPKKEYRKYGVNPEESLYIASK